VPARISTITFFSSLGSRGSSSFSSRSTIVAARFERVLLVVGHLLHFRVVRFDQQLLGALQAFSISFHSRYFATISAISACVLASFW
jgi:hypothetical protein